MSIDFNKEHTLIQHEIQSFTSTVLKPISADIDKNAVFPVNIMERLSALGFMGILIPEEYDGAGLDAVSLCIILSELSRESASVGLAVAVHSCLVSYPILRFASSELKKKQLPGLARGEIAAFSPDIGLDGHNANLAVHKRGSSFVMDGTSLFVFNGETANLFLVPVAHEQHLFQLIHRDDTVLTEPQYLLGLRAAGIVKTRFNGSTIGGCAFVDLPGAAAALREIYAFADLAFSAVALGIAEACLGAAIAYSKERRQFQKALCEFPMVQSMLVDMKEGIEAARLLTFDAARSCDRGDDFIMAAHIARLHACAAAVNAGTTSVQIHGGYGYIKDYPVERYLRDSKALEVLIRPPHETRSVIAKELLV